MSNARTILCDHYISIFMAFFHTHQFMFFCAFTIPKEQILLPLHRSCSSSCLTPLNTHVFNAKPPSISFFEEWWSQCHSWISIECMNCICRYFCPKWFVEVYTLKHVPCHLHNGVIFIFCHSIVLRPIMNVMFCQKNLKFFLNEAPFVNQPKHLDLLLQLCFYK